MLNDGSGTRFDIRKQIKSCVDLTMVSASIAVKCQWEVLEKSSTGSDHFPVICTVGLEMQRSMMIKQYRWKFEKADWEKYNRICESELRSYSIEDDIDKGTKKLSLILVKAAEGSIPKVEGHGKKKAVPWWNEECSKSIKSRNKAFKVLKRTLTPEAVIEYQRERAKARKTIKRVKKKYWRDYCSSIGKETIGRYGIC